VLRRALSSGSHQLDYLSAYVSSFKHFDFAPCELFSAASSISFDVVFTYCIETRDYWWEWERLIAVRDFTHQWNFGIGQHVGGFGFSEDDFGSLL
jgi:hypothetical protein